MRARVALAALLAALLTGCAGDGEGGAALTAADLPKLVLQEGDLADVFIPFDVGPQGSREASPRSGNVDPTRFGRLGGHKARYRRPGPQRPTGPVVIESKVDVFESTDGAEEDFDLLSDGIEENYGVADNLRVPRLGDETVGTTFRQGSGRFATRFFVLAWRQENATAFLLVHGIDPVTLDDAERLARRVEAHIADATES